MLRRCNCRIPALSIALFPGGLTQSPRRAHRTAPLAQPLFALVTQSQALWQGLRRGRGCSCTPAPTGTAWTVTVPPSSSLADGTFFALPRSLSRSWRCSASTDPPRDGCSVSWSLSSPTLPSPPPSPSSRSLSSSSLPWPPCLVAEQTPVPANVGQGTPPRNEAPKQPQLCWKQPARQKGGGEPVVVMRGAIVVIHRARQARIRRRHRHCAASAAALHWFNSPLPFDDHQRLVRMISSEGASRANALGPVKGQGDGWPSIVYFL
jgi:hypothetical protein